jgi:hypothetical protein
VALCTVLTCDLSGVEGKWVNAQFVVGVVLLALAVLAAAVNDGGSVDGS